jgi:hypothetical protein
VASGAQKVWVANNFVWKQQQQQKHTLCEYTVRKL